MEGKLAAEPVPLKELAKSFRNARRRTAIRQAGTHRPVSARSLGVHWYAMSIASKKRKVVRVDELTPPKMIANEDFTELCETFHIPSSHRQDVKARLDELVTEFADWITTERKQPDRRSDHDRLKEALAQINGAAAAIERLGASGRLALKAVAPVVAPMLAAQWISESFPIMTTSRADPQ